MIFTYLKEIQLRYTQPVCGARRAQDGDAYFEKEEYEQAAIEYEEF
jgi:hypothetical protein